MEQNIILSIFIIYLTEAKQIHKARAARIKMINM